MFHLFQFGGLHNIRIGDERGTGNSTNTDIYEFSVYTSEGYRVMRILGDADADVFIDQLTLGGEAGTLRSTNVAGILNLKGETGTTITHFGAGGGDYISGDLTIKSYLILQGTDTSDRFIQINGPGAPNAPAANHARLYVDQGGAGGKSRLLVIFDSGATQVITNEP